MATAGALPTYVTQVLAALDPRLVGDVRAELHRRLAAPPGPWRPGKWVLAGQRAAGKSRLLPFFAEGLGRPGIDLDSELERQSGRKIREWFAQDPKDFRAAERRVFTELPDASVIAVGGGFLSLHADLLTGCVVVRVPVTFETYRERLLADPTRPRLRPELSIEDELATIFTDREKAHAALSTLSVAEALAMLVQRGGR